MASMMRSAGDEVRIDQKVRQMLDSDSPRVKSLIQMLACEKKYEADRLFENLPPMPEVANALRRWAALDVLLTGYGNVVERSISREEYDSGIKPVLTLLREQARSKAKAESLMQTAPAVPVGEVAGKCRFLEGLFEDCGVRGRPLRGAAEKMAKLDMLLRSGRVTDEEYDHIQDMILNELREAISPSDLHRGITPSSSISLYGRMSSALQASRRRTS